LTCDHSIFLNGHGKDNIAVFLQNPTFVLDNLDGMKIDMGSLFNLTCKPWLILPSAFLALSVAAVLVRLSHYYYVPHAIGSALDSFTQPGEIVWWWTVGGLFAGYPSTLPGFAVLVVANVAFWSAASVCVVLVRSWVLTHLRQEKNDS
jgi:hypothetical protein